MLPDILLFLAGVILLLAGGWSLVEGGSRLAALLGVPTVLVGATVVAWGTSAPELVVSMTAAFRGNADLMLRSLQHRFSRGNGRNIVALGPRRERPTEGLK